MKTKLVLGCLLVALVILLGISGQATAQVETIPPDQCYGGVETTELGYYDTTMGAYVGVPVRCLPWWWDPLYLPLGWTVLTPAIVPVAFVDGCFFTGSYISFSSSTVRIVDHNFRHFHGHIHGLRGDWRRHHDRGFEKGRHHAHEKYGRDLRKPPHGFKHASVRGGKYPPGPDHKGKPSDRDHRGGKNIARPDRHPGAGKPDSHHGGKPAATPGKGGPPPGKFSPPPTKGDHHSPTQKAGPPPPKSGAPGSKGKASAPPKGSSPPSPAASGRKLPPPAKSANVHPGQARGSGQPGMNRAPGQFGGGGGMRGQAPSAGRASGMGAPRGGGGQAPRVAAPKPSGGGGGGGRGGGGGGGKSQPQQQKKDK